MDLESFLENIELSEYYTISISNNDKKLIDEFMNGAVEGSTPAIRIKGDYLYISALKGDYKKLFLAMRKNKKIIIGEPYSKTSKRYMNYIKDVVNN